MADKLGKITFTTEDNEEIEFFVLEQTMINGVDYILVADSDNEEEEANALILKEKTSANDETIYDVVEEEQELLSISKIFEELLENIDIEMEK